MKSSIIPLLMHAQAVADMRLLADRYERLAHYLEVADVKSPTSIESPSLGLYSQDKAVQRAN